MKIQHLPARLTTRTIFAAALVYAGAIFAPGCKEQSADDDIDNSARVTDRSRFGDDYEIVTNFFEAEPDFMPQLSRDSLVVRLTYTGGCDDHDFDLEDEVEGDTARVWLHHDAAGDDCGERVQDELRFRLPEDVMEARIVVLLSPQGSDPYIVKRGKQSG